MIKPLHIILVILLSAYYTNAQSNYTFYKSIPVGDGLGWDYLAADEANRLMYVSHGTKVLIVSMDEEKIIGEISNTPGVHGIALDHKLHRGYISCGRTNSVSVFDLPTFKVIDTIALSGTNPDAILYDAFSDKVFAFNGRSANVSVIDPMTLKEIKIIPLTGKPEFSVTDLKGNIYVNNEDKSEITHIDANSFAVKHTWSISPGEEPSGLAIDRQNNLLFSVCSNKKLIIFDIQAEKVIETIAIGGGVDAVVFDPSTRLIYTSNGEGSVTIFKQRDPSHYQIVQTLSTQRGCRTMMIDPKTKYIYLPAAKYEGETRRIVAESFEILVFKP